jgi:condensin complex subunit 1
MRTLYEDGRVDSEVVSTLWQVYCTCKTENVYSLLELKHQIAAEREIPRFQRRGAIIVLGMFALARSEIITDRVETLLRIGLGSLGRVS